MVANEHESALRAGHRDEQVEWHRARGLIHHDGVVALGALERCKLLPCRLLAGRSEHRGVRDDGALDCFGLSFERREEPPRSLGCRVSGRVLALLDVVTQLAQQLEDIGANARDGVLGAIGREQIEQQPSAKHAKVVKE